jgi:heme A synthase
MSERAQPTSHPAFIGVSSFSWGVLGFLLLVILWGSFVRASGSGAGCGTHWPLCTGELIPQTPSWKTIVEYIHRVTSGLSLILCIGIWLMSLRQFPKGSLVRKAGVAVLCFILSEALLGAALVLLRLVENDQSLLRAVSLAVHLINTFFLLAAVTLCARWAEQKEGTLVLRKKSRLAVFASIAAVLAVLVLAASGAVTALGDTLFPVATLQAGFAQDLSPTRHFLISLRIFHPLIAVLVSLLLIVFARGVLDRTRPRLMFHSWMVLGLQILQMSIGVLNLFMLAPVGMQLVHLLVADLVWINLVLLLAEVWTEF